MLETICNINARTKLYEDVIVSQKYFDHNMLDTLIKYKRANKDKEVNKYGKKPMDLRENSWRTGRTLGDVQGKYTCFEKH